MIKRQKRTQSHVIFGRIFLIGGIVSAIGSAFVGYQVLDFMVTSERTWDFQGASGMASVVPGMAGIILAGWAIYHQIRVTSPSYRAAEEVLIEFSNYRRTYTRMVSVMVSSTKALSSEVDAANEALRQSDPEGLDDYLPEAVPIKMAPRRLLPTAEEALRDATNTHTRKSAAIRMKLERVAEELLTDLNHVCHLAACPACNAHSNSNRTSFAGTSFILLPIIATLQDSPDFPEMLRLNIEKIEENIEVYGSKFNETLFEDNAALLMWCNDVMKVIYDIDRTMNGLRDQDLLSPKHVERALLHPVQSRDLERDMESLKLAKEELAKRR